MPRIKRIPSYRLHRPSGQAVVTLNGRDRYLGEWNSESSKEEYDRVVGEWLAQSRLPLQRDGLLQDTNIFRLTLTFAKPEWAKVQAVLGDKPAETFMQYVEAEYEKTEEKRRKEAAKKKQRKKKQATGK